MKTLSSILALSLLLNGFAMPQEARAEEAGQVCATDTFASDTTTPKQISEKCGTARDCVNTRAAVAEWSKQYKELAEKACQKHRESVSKINDLNQSSSFGEVKAKAEAGIGDINALLAANERILKAIPDKTDQNIKTLKQLAASTSATAAFKSRMNEIGATFTRSRHRPELLKNEVIKATDNSGISGAEAAASKANLDALGQSQQFVRSLLMDKEKNQAALRELNQAKNDAARNQSNTSSAESNTQESSGSGFNPMSLLPLAAPLASLLMQQQAQQDSGLSDALTNPTDPYASGNESTSTLGSTSLETKSNGQTSGNSIANAKSADPQMHMPTESYGGSAAAEPAAYDGGISRGQGENKSGGAAGSGSYSASGGGFSGASGDSGSAKDKKDRKPANAPVASNEEGLIASGGGGGGAYSASSSSETSESDGSMKDMLHDMEATLEDSPTGLFAETDHSNSSDGVGPENSESLFPRVRACYVRSLKKGFVLNGLGEKLPESD